MSQNAAPARKMRPAIGPAPRSRRRWQKSTVRNRQPVQRRTPVRLPTNRPQPPRPWHRPTPAPCPRSRLERQIPIQPAPGSRQVTPLLHPQPMHRPLSTRHLYPLLLFRSVPPNTVGRMLGVGWPNTSVSLHRSRVAGFGNASVLHRTMRSRFPKCWALMKPVAFAEPTSCPSSEGNRHPCSSAFIRG